MPRLAVLSDIHGNLPALEAVLADAEAWNADAIVVAGDAICWGPQSREVLELLRTKNAGCIRGNNEYYLLDWETPRMPEAWRRYSLLPPLYEDLGETWRQRIALWPDSLSIRLPDAPLIHVCHGLPDNPWQGIFPRTEPDLSGVEAPILVAGHTHLPMDETVSGKRVVNPGSVGVPLDRDRRAQYVRFESLGGDWSVTHRRVAYDFAKLDAAWLTTNFLARNGRLADLVVAEFETAELQVIPFLRFQKEVGNEEQARAGFTDEVRLCHTPPPYRR